MTILRRLVLSALLLALPASALAAPAPGELAAAAQKGDLAKVSALLADGASPDDRGTGSATALMLAAETRHPDVVKALLAAGADPKATRDNAITALHHAAATDCADCITALIAAHADVDAAAANGRTPLLSALAHKNWASATALLAAGATLKPTPLGEQALLLALDDSYLSASLGEDTATLPVDMAQRLVKLGAKTDLKTPKGLTPLHLAAHARQPEMVALLLKQGAKVDDVTNAGETPLLLAAKSASLELLLTGLSVASSIVPELGLDPSLDSRAQLKRIVAQDFPSTHAGKLMPRIVALRDRRKRTLELLLAAGANPNAADKEGHTALQELASDGDAGATETLLAGKADPDIVRAGGYSAMMIAAANGYADQVRILLARGAKVDLRNEVGETALMRASIAGGDGDTVAVLLAAKPDVNAVSDKGQTALMYAVGARPQAILDGAQVNPELERVVGQLLAAGADASLKDKDGKTAADYAGASSKYRAARRTLEKAERAHS